MSRKKRPSFKSLPRSIKIRKIITWIFTAIGLACLGYFAFYVKQASNTQNNYDAIAELKNKSEEKQETIEHTTLVMHRAEDEETPDILPEFTDLYAKNKSIVGWISIDDTTVDYPVMQSSNEDYYLTHNFSQESDNNGSIFLDSACSIWPRSQNLIIYGHNMKSGKMFGALKKYKDFDYYEKHPIIYFDTLYDKGSYQIMYAFGDMIYDETDVVFKYYQFIDANSEEEWNSAMSYMSEKSLYDTNVTASYGDELITLSTCDYEKDAERFVIVAKKIN